MCVCVCVCVFGQDFFVNTYLIKQYKYFLSTYFCIYTFKLPYQFYDIRQELYPSDDGQRSGRKYKGTN